MNARSGRGSPARGGGEDATFGGLLLATMTPVIRGRVRNGPEVPYLYIKPNLRRSR